MQTLRLGLVLFWVWVLVVCVMLNFSWLSNETIFIKKNYILAFCNTEFDLVDPCKSGIYVRLSDHKNTGD